MSLIETRDLWKTYSMGAEDVHALSGVSININKGEYLAIMGPSGSGKSTLMNLIGCLDTPSRGEYLLRGKKVNEMNDDELWETTMDPERRVLLRVKAEEAEEAERMFSLLMGDNVELRRNFIEEHALEVKNLDV